MLFYVYTPHSDNNVFHHKFLITIHLNLDMSHTFIGDQWESTTNNSTSVSIFKIRLIIYKIIDTYSIGQNFAIPNFVVLQFPKLFFCVV